MDKQKQIEEMIGIIQGAVGGCARNWAELIAEALYNVGCRNISKAASDCLAGEDMGLKIIDCYIHENRELSAKNKEIRRETAEKFAERLKEESSSCYATCNGVKVGDTSYTISESKIDEICKEITEGKV